MFTPQIFKRDANGSIRVWQGEAIAGRWRSHTGVMGGATITSEWADAPPKSRPNSLLQAEFECTAQYQKLLAKDYRQSVALIDVPRGSFIRPMLANKYPGWIGRCSIQPKLDGMRCLANVDGLWSRGAKPIISAPHIIEQLGKFFKNHPSIVLDGELYNHDLVKEGVFPIEIEEGTISSIGFNALMSILKKTRPTEDDIKKSEAIVQYHVYDCFDLALPNSTFKERMNMLQSTLDEYGSVWPSVGLVNTINCGSKECLDNNHAEFVAQGYEGSIIRLDKPYEQKRSNTLLKNKDFITEEFTLLRIEEGEGNWKGYAKRAVCITPNGVEFGAGIRGNQSFCQTLLSADVSSFQSVTIRHFGMTPDGSIRFPIAIEFNEKNSIENRPSSISTSIEDEM